MLKHILITAYTTIALVRAGNEPLEFVVSTLEQTANKLERLASILEDHVPQKE